MFSVWTKAQDNDNIIGRAKVVSVSVLFSRCCILAFSLLFYDSVTLCTVNLFVKIVDGGLYFIFPFHFYFTFLSFSFLIFYF